MQCYYVSQVTISSGKVRQNEIFGTSKPSVAGITILNKSPAKISPSWPPIKGPYNFLLLFKLGRNFPHFRTGQVKIHLRLEFDSGVGQTYLLLYMHIRIKWGWVLRWVYYISHKVCLNPSIII